MSIACFRPRSGRTPAHLCASVWIAVTGSLLAFDSIDINGDGVSDPGIFRPLAVSSQFWFHNASGTPIASAIFGAPGDIPLAADYDGDGISDVAVKRPGNREFLWKRSSDGVTQSVLFGNMDDIGVTGDFDGDGKTDVANLRIVPMEFWWIRSSDSTIMMAQLGSPGDIPLIADYDGDGKSDFGVFRPGETPKFIYKKSSDSVIVQESLGQTGDLPISGDFDGDGSGDLALYRPLTAQFIYKKSSNAAVLTTTFGDVGDKPLAGDFDGDGKSDIAIFRAVPGTSNQFWYIRSSDGLLSGTTFGDPGDYPLAFQSYEPSLGPVPAGTFVNTPGARQTVYLSGVPHTDRNGLMRNSYQPDSFFMKAMYHALTTNVHYGVGYSYAALKNAGFNTVIPFWGDPLTTVLSEASANDMQVISNMRVDPGQPPAPQISAAQTIAATYVNHPNVLGWYMEEEPTGAPDEAVRWQNYLDLKAAVLQVDPDHIPLVLDANWLEQAGDPSIAAMWNKWNSSSSVSCHDNYPFVDANVTTMDSNLGIPRSITRAVTINSAQKPVWLTVQAFEQPNWTLPFHWIMPTPTQLRAQIFAGLVHGATGIVYFALDSHVTRAGNVIGAAPNPALDYGVYMTANASQVLSSQILWQSIPGINAELERLEKIILTTTAPDSYTVEVSGPKVSSDPIRTLLKRRDGVYTLLAVNLDKATLLTRVTLPFQPMDLRRVGISGASEPVAPYGETIYETFAPYEVKVFQFQ